MKSKGNFEQDTKPQSSYTKKAEFSRNSSVFLENSASTQKIQKLIKLKDMWEVLVFSPTLKFSPASSSAVFGRNWLSPLQT